MKYYIVWNEDKSEGFVTNDKSDAEDCLNGKFGTVYSTDEDKVSIQEIEL